jgi:hypothetical protein
MNKLQYRIRQQLKSGPSTPHDIAEGLNVNIDAVESQLRRMKKKGIVRNPAWGVWELVTKIAEPPIQTGPTDIEPSEVQEQTVNETEHQDPFEAAILEIASKLKPQDNRLDVQQLVSKKYHALLDDYIKDRSSYSPGNWQAFFRAAVDRLGDGELFI